MSIRIYFHDRFLKPACSERLSTPEKGDPTRQLHFGYLFYEKQLFCPCEGWPEAISELIRGCFTVCKSTKLFAKTFSG
jgi:hypothetical protein